MRKLKRQSIDANTKMAKMPKLIQQIFKTSHAENVSV